MPFLRSDCNGRSSSCRHDLGGRLRFALESADSCAYRWLSFSQLRARVVRHHSWLLFVGDSDTRFLVYELLQILAAGSYSQTTAKQYPGLWLGNMGPTPEHTWNRSLLNRSVVKTHEREWYRESKDWMRLCLVDFIYDAQGSIRSRDAVHCTEGREQEYAIAGQAYALNMSVRMPDGGLRVTFVGTSTYNQTQKCLAGLIASLGANGAAQRPTMLYAGIGSWYGSAYDKFGFGGDQGAQRASALVAQLDELAALVPPPSTHVFATVLGQPNRNATFSKEYLEPQVRGSKLHAWRIFDRGYGANPLSWNVTASGSHGLRMVDGHAPPLLSYIDWQRLLSNTHGASRSWIAPHPHHHTSATVPDNAGAAADDGDGCETLAFVSSCAGWSWAANRGDWSPGKSVWAEAMHHFCGLHTVSARAPPLNASVSGPRLARPG